MLGAALASCLSILWPLAVAKFTPETLLECFGTVLRLLREYASFRQAHEARVCTRVEQLLSQLVASYRYSITNASNKKKVRTDAMLPVFTDSRVHPAFYRVLREPPAGLDRVHRPAGWIVVPLSLF